MQLVVFGLAVSSSWGNGHATLWRGLCAALHRRGHRVVFFERDVPYYRRHRDLTELPGGRLVLYDDWASAVAIARAELVHADAVIVTSYCPDALEAAVLAQDARGIRVFYDLDTGVTLERIAHGEPVAYIGSRGLADYDLVLSYTGGRALDALQQMLSARRVAPLYGSVDPHVHSPVPPVERYRCDLSYLATHAPDRHGQVLELLVATAAREPTRRFLIAGPQYPLDFPWRENLHYIEHIAPVHHAAFYCSSRVTLNLTRAAMARMGYCPSGRLFEAAAVGVPMLSDEWVGLDAFFEPGVEIIPVRSRDDVLCALELDDSELRRIAEAARARVLAHHTANARAAELEAILGDVAAGRSAAGMQPSGHASRRASGHASLEVTHVGDHSRGGSGQPHTAAGILEGAAAGRQPSDGRHGAAPGSQ